MTVVKRPPESDSRSLRLEQPVSDLLDRHSRFVDGTADYVADFALRKMLARDPDYEKWIEGQNRPNTGKHGALLQPPGKPS